MNEYLLDWNNACVYAMECFPPFFYDLTRKPLYYMTKEPYSVLSTIALCCFLAYKWSGNKRRK